jgi:hypothetical protein
VPEVGERDHPEKKKRIFSKGTMILRKFCTSGSDSAYFQ